MIAACGSSAVVIVVVMMFEANSNKSISWHKNQIMSLTCTEIEDKKLPLHKHPLVT